MSFSATLLTVSADPSQPVLLEEAAQGSARLLARMRAQQASRQQVEATSRVNAQKALVQRLTVKHKAIPDPDAYDKLEQVVLKAKAAHEAKLESQRQLQTARASLRKGGLNEYQELVTVLPPSSGPVGRLGHPEKLFGDRILVDSP